MSATSFPKISVITPSFNQGQFLEETINSVLSQNYPNIEYIVVDGKSTDGSHDIIKKYQNRLRWISDPDKSQVDAINTGLRKATGDILAYLNSDDLYNIGTFNLVAKFFSDNPDKTWLTGDCVIVDTAGKEINKSIRCYKALLSKINNRSVLGVANFISQPSTFIKRELFEEVGFFNENLEYTMDLDYWLRCYKKAKPEIIGASTPLSRFRIHTESKGGNRYGQQFRETESVLRINHASAAVRILNHLHNKIVVTLYSNYYKKIRAK